MLNLTLSRDGLASRSRQIVAIDDDIERRAIHAMSCGEDGVGGDEGAAAELVACRQGDGVAVASGGSLCLCKSLCKYHIIRT